MNTLLVLLAASVAFSFTASTSAFGKTADTLCLGGRAKAQGKYESCVQRAMASIYLGGEAALGEHYFVRLSKCREKYAAAWNKLVTLNASWCAGDRWVDNGDGTVSDHLTGLIWEKKTNLDSTPNPSDPHDADNTYYWTNWPSDGDDTDEDGTVFTEFLTNLNAGGGFAGANGWRLPTYAELLTILLPERFPCTTLPCIDSVFGPTDSSPYWSSTTGVYSSIGARFVYFDYGYSSAANKTTPLRVRAVRSGW